MTPMSEDQKWQLWAVDVITRGFLQADCFQAGKSQLEMMAS